MSVTAIVEEIMTQHWRPTSEGICHCWICTEGRKAGCRARSRYLPHYRRHSWRGRVWVDPQDRDPTWRSHAPHVKEG